MRTRNCSSAIAPIGRSGKPSPGRFPTGGDDGRPQRLNGMAMACRSSGQPPRRAESDSHFRRLTDPTLVAIRDDTVAYAFEMSRITEDLARCARDGGM